MRCSCCVMIVGCACRRGDDFHTTVMRADLSATARVGLFAIIVALPAGYSIAGTETQTETRRRGLGEPLEGLLQTFHFEYSSVRRCSARRSRHGPGADRTSPWSDVDSPTRTKRQYRAKTTIILFVHAPLFEPDRATVRYRN